MCLLSPCLFFYSLCLRYWGPGQCCSGRTTWPPCWLWGTRPGWFSSSGWRMDNSSRSVCSSRSENVELESFLWMCIGKNIRYVLSHDTGATVQYIVICCVTVGAVIYWGFFKQCNGIGNKRNLYSETKYILMNRYFFKNVLRMQQNHHLRRVIF